MRRVSMLVVVVAIVLAGLYAVGRPARGTVAQDGTPAAMGAHPVVGTWLLDTDADDPANAPEVVIFTGDGGYISVDAEGGTGLGVWEATGEGTAVLTLVSPFGDEEGFFGTFTIRATVEVDAAGEAFTAEYTGEFTDPAGTGTGEYGPSLATATRIVAEAPGTPVGTLDELFAQFEEEGTPEAGTPAP